MKTIKLTQGKVALVDDADFSWLNQHKWYAHKHFITWYARRMKRQGDKQTTVLMHQQILKPPVGMETDHKNHDGLNNQRYNLRVATHSQNLHNGRKRKGGTSRFKGVCWERRRATWRAEIQVERRAIFLGHFLSEIAAAQAYDAAAIKYFGEFAQTNFRRKVS